MKRKLSFLISIVLIVLSLPLNISAEVEDIVGLKDLFGDYFLIGTCVNERDLEGERAELLKLHFNAATCENYMKPDGMQKVKGNFTFDKADKVADYMLENDIKMIGHTLAWHSQSPNWLNSAGMSRDEAITNLEEHIAGVASHYAGKILSWDVLNEAIDDSIGDPTDWKKALRKTQWLSTIGDDYVEIAFNAAEKADPNAKLYYNDYNLDNPKKREAVYHMVKELREKGVKIDGIGMQGHYNINTSIGNVRDSIELFTSLGVEVSITELDVTIPDSVGVLNKEQEEKQALKYAELFKVFIEFSDSIERVTFWGMDDASSWRGKQFPLIFDKNLKAKAAYYALTDIESYIENAVYGVQEFKEGTALRGTPTIDGEIDEIWNNAKALDINNYLFAWQGAVGTVKALWDEKNLYALYEVTDKVLNSASRNAYEQDSIELFLDENNKKSAYYELDDGQYRVSYENKLTGGDSTNLSGVERAVSLTDTGYVVEIAVPFRTISPANGTLVGFDAQINDANVTGMRISVSKWNDTTDMSYADTSRWGTLKLVGDEIKTETGVETVQTSIQPENESSDENIPSSGFKFSIGHIAVIILIIVIILSFIFGFKKKNT